MAEPAHLALTLGNVLIGAHRVGGPKMTGDFFKASSFCIVSGLARPPHRYRFVEAQSDHYPVRLLCQLTKVTASGY